MKFSFLNKYGGWYICEKNDSVGIFILFVGYCQWQQETVQVRQPLSSWIAFVHILSSGLSSLSSKFCVEWCRKFHCNHISPSHCIYNKMTWCYNNISSEMLGKNWVRRLKSHSEESKISFFYGLQHCLFAQIVHSYHLIQSIKVKVLSYNQAVNFFICHP